MQNLAVYLKKYRKESILAPLFKLLEALFDLFVPLVIARMIDTDAASNRHLIFLYFGVLLLLAFVGLGFSIVAQFFSAKASVGFAGAVRQAVFDHIQTFSFTELDAIGRDTLSIRCKPASIWGSVCCSAARSSC